MNSKIICLVLIVSILLNSCKEKEKEKENEDVKIEVQSLRFNADFVKLNCGDSLKLAVIHLPANIEAPIFKWSSSDESVVSVNNIGVVKAKNIGTVLIAVSTIDDRRKATIKVKSSPTLVLNYSNVIMKINDTLRLIATTNPQIKVDWGCNSDNVVKVENGFITAISKGEAYVTAKVNDSVFARCSITVYKPVSGIMFEDSIMIRFLNNDIHSYSLPYKISPEDANNKKVTWLYDSNYLDIIEENINDIASVRFLTKKTWIYKTNCKIR